MSLSPARLGLGRLGRGRQLPQDPESLEQVPPSALQLVHQSSYLRCVELVVDEHTVGKYDEHQRLRCTPLVERFDPRTHELEIVAELLQWVAAVDAHVDLDIEEVDWHCEAVSVPHLVRHCVGESCRKDETVEACQYLHGFLRSIWIIGSCRRRTGSSDDFLPTKYKPQDINVLKQDRSRERIIQ